jgi:hypothetical protein
MKYYSATQKNEIMTFAGKIELENIMLSKISQFQEAKYHVFAHLQNVDLKQR